MNFNEWEQFKQFPWWGKVLGIVAGAPIIGLAIILAPFWLPVLVWGWWLDRKSKKATGPPNGFATGVATVADREASRARAPDSPVPGEHTDV